MVPLSPRFRRMRSQPGLSIAQYCQFAATAWIKVSNSFSCLRCGAANSDAGNSICRMRCVTLHFYPSPFFKPLHSARALPFTRLRNDFARNIRANCRPNRGHMTMQVACHGGHECLGRQDFTLGLTCKRATRARISNTARGKASKGPGSLERLRGGRTSRDSTSGPVFIDGSLMQQDYYSVLASVIMASARDDPRLRRMIYELARSKLRQQLAWETRELSNSERAQQLLALETAIEEIEADLAKNIRRRTYSGTNILAPVTHSPIEVMLPARHLSSLSEARQRIPAEHTARPTSSIFRWVLPLVAAAILGVAIYVTIERGLREEPQSKVEADQNIPDNSISSYQSAIPIPGAYGVYALTNGQLTELEPLPIKVPDQRVFGAISTASKTKLPNGRIQFIVFRRDQVNNAPEKVVVRVVAQVMHASASSRKGVATS